MCRSCTVEVFGAREVNIGVLGISNVEVEFWKVYRIDSSTLDEIRVERSSQLRLTKMNHNIRHLLLHHGEN